MTARRAHACFSRPGWWQTLCGLDAANQGFGWTSTPAKVGCSDCRKRLARGDHLRRAIDAVLVPRPKAPRHAPRVHAMRAPEARS